MTQLAASGSHLDFPVAMELLFLSRYIFTELVRRQKGLDGGKGPYPVTGKQGTQSRDTHSSQAVREVRMMKGSHEVTCWERHLFRQVTA